MKRIDTEDLVGQFVKMYSSYGVVLGYENIASRQIMLIYLFDNGSGNDRIAREFPNLVLRYVKDYLDSMKEI